MSDILFDKLILLLCCCGFTIISANSFDAVVPILITLTITCLNSSVEKPYFCIITFSFFTLLCMFHPIFLYFLPLAAFDLFSEKYQSAIGFISIPMLLYYRSLSGIQVILILILLAVSYLLKKHSNQIKKLRNDYIALRDETTELSALLKKKNKELIEKQDYEVNLATLNERNRIAREIHDNIGHILSRSILQTGALIAIAKDNALKANLTELKDSLNSGMNSIRNSIHNIHEDSLDLEARLEHLVKEFTFCRAYLDYQIHTDLSIKVKYTLLSIVTEALSNIIKHSNATQVTISFIEQPAFYQLIIIDNGTVLSAASNPESMGIASMTERIHSLSGNFHIDTANGFRIFITLPKEEH